MMMDPEWYYEEHLKGKSADEIRAQIRRLQQQIRQLQKEAADPNSDGWMICPSPEVQLEMHRLYLKKAKEALVDTIERQDAC